MADHQPFPPGARRVARPAAVSPCPSCGDLAGRGYPGCRFCAELVDQYWLLDWQELLAAEQLTEGGAGERELAELVLADEVGRHPWTCTDWAMTLVACSQCGEELGAGPVDCWRCAVADGLRWSWDHTGYPGAMTAGEHLLRVARAALRAPHRRRAAVVRAWRLLLPFLLAGDLPTVGQLRRVRAAVIAGDYAELAGCASHVELASFPELPWRRPERPTRPDHQPRPEPDDTAPRTPAAAQPVPDEPAADPV
ncbi:hypothetical protein Q5530_35900 [Saccharothrix sp. BKS2]|uniref:hypothetical protein n=1 Tax=Saccharothrix sp. BKS2 TaxID=3064400 RepID=UPI0039E90D47